MIVRVWYISCSTICEINIPNYIFKLGVKETGVNVRRLYSDIAFSCTRRSPMCCKIVCGARMTFQSYVILTICVRYPVWQHTFVSPSAFSRRAVVSYWRKYVHEVLVNRLGGLSLPRKSVVRLTDRPDMTLDVYRGRKTTKQHNMRYAYYTRHVSLIVRCKKIGYNIDVLRQTACLVVNPVKVNSFAYPFNYTMVPS